MSLIRKNIVIYNFKKKRNQLKKSLIFVKNLNFKIMRTSNTLVIILSLLIAFGCNPLKKMIKLAEEKQKITANPNPLVIHGGKLCVEAKVSLPVGMIKKGTSYTVNFTYNDVEIGSIDFLSEIYATRTASSTSSSNVSDSTTNYRIRGQSTTTKTVTMKIVPSDLKTFCLDYQEDFNPGKLKAVGVAKLESSGETASTITYDVADGAILTAFLGTRNLSIPKSAHGYNEDEELIPFNVDFFFDQGRSNLKKSEKISDRGERFSAFVAERNPTKSVKILGSHSPEGSTKINDDLANKRAAIIETYYRQQMDKYDYRNEASNIKFDLQPVVEDWGSLRGALNNSDVLNSDEKSEISRIINGGGNFVDKEKALSKLSSYKKIMKSIYPNLRISQTEVMTAKVKKPNNEIAAIAKKIVSGEASSDALSEDELLFSATLTPSLNERASIYEAAVKKTGSWRAHNDYGSIHINLAREEELNSEAQNKLMDAAETQLEIALNKKETAETHLNLAAIHSHRGNHDLAYEHVEKAKGLNSERMKTRVQYSLGTLDIAKGHYDLALKNLAMSNKDYWGVSWKKAIAHIMLGNIDDAKTALILEAEQMKNVGYESNGGNAYALAICAARDGDSSTVTKYLKEAIGINKYWKERVVNDLEFRDHQDAVKEAM